MNEGGINTVPQDTAIEGFFASQVTYDNETPNPSDPGDSAHRAWLEEGNQADNLSSTLLDSNPVDFPKTAIILAGGLGTRLRSVIGERPKTLADIAGRPFLDYLLTYLVEQGLQRVILSLGYQSEMVRAFVGNGAPWGLEIKHVEEQIPLGTGGALRYASAILDAESESAPFFVLNGDTLFNIALHALWTFHQSFRNQPAESANILPLATLALREIPLEPGEIGQRGMVQLGHDGKIVSFEEKSLSASIQSPKEVLINGGVYIFTLEGLADIPFGQPISLEKQVFPALASKGCLAGMAASGYFVDIGVPENLTRFEDDVRKGRLRWSKEIVDKIN